MPYQVNLYSPILLAPRRHFSARAMARALGVLLLGIVALSLWLVQRGATQAQALQHSQRFADAERQRLNTLLAGRGALPLDLAALQQEMAREQAALARLQQEHQALMRGTVREGRSPAALLGLLAGTVPAPVWLHSVHIDDGELRFSGWTLQPEALRPWMAALAAHPLTATQRLGVARVDRVPVEGGGPERWQFRVSADQGTRPEARP